MIPSEKIIVALDIKDLSKARSLVNLLGPEGVAFKIGLQPFLLWGSGFVDELVERKFRVFLDLKFHDIPNTVANAVEAAHRMGVWMVNMHAAAGSRAMRAAREILQSLPAPRPLLIGVTVLTSLSPEDLQGIRLPDDPQDWAVHLASLASVSGMDGVVCSPREVRKIKEATSDSFIAVTPGIRLPESGKDDQRRVTTPLEALAAGSDYLVVGRPIVRADDPLEGLRAVQNH